MEYTLTFRTCDIVPEMKRHENSWEENGKSNAINEVLRIDQNLDILWDIKSETEEEEQYIIVAAARDDMQALIERKYDEYQGDRMVDILKQRKGQTS